MSMKQILKTMLTTFIMICGMFVVGHFLFKLLMNELHYFDEINWLGISTAAVGSLSMLAFYSRKPFTRRRLFTRAAVQCAALTAVIGYVYGYNDRFMLMQMPHPVLGMLGTLALFVAGYVLIFRATIYRDYRMTLLLNEALAEYKLRHADA